MTRLNRGKSGRESAERLALKRIHDALADHPRWHDIAPRFDGPMDVVQFIRDVLDEHKEAGDDR